MKYVAIITAFSTFGAMEALGVEIPSPSAPPLPAKSCCSYICSSCCSCMRKACCAVSGLTVVAASLALAYNSSSREFQLEHHYSDITGFISEEFRLKQHYHLNINNFASDDFDMIGEVSYSVRFPDGSVLCDSMRPLPWWRHIELDHYIFPETGCTVYNNYYDKAVLLPAEQFSGSCCFTQYANSLAPRDFVSAMIATMSHEVSGLMQLLRGINSFSCAHSGVRSFVHCNRSFPDHAPSWSKKCLLKSEIPNPGLEDDRTVYTCTEIADNEINYEDMRHN